jgi:hypothetical protein
MGDNVRHPTATHPTSSEWLPSLHIWFTIGIHTAAGGQLFVTAIVTVTPR